MEKKLTKAQVIQAPIEDWAEALNAVAREGIAQGIRHVQEGMPIDNDAIHKTVLDAMTLIISDVVVPSEDFFNNGIRESVN